MLFTRKKSHNSEVVDSLKILDKDTPFAIKEAFKALHVNILYLPIEDECKKIAITSAHPGEGKTYTSINLAITIAQNSDDKKVLLIDMDLRKSTVSKLISNRVGKTKIKNGLSEYITGITKEPAIVKTDVPGLSVLFAGAEPANPTSLIASNKFSELIKKCEADYDFIIIDTPPVTVVSDAALLAEKVNGYIISVRSDYSTTTSISSLISTLEGVNANILGFVYTDEKVKSSKHYGGYYSSYSSNEKSK